MFLRYAVLALVVAGCSGSETTWQSLDMTEPAALLSVWGTSVDDVWITGGRTGLAGSPTLLHRHAGAWQRVDTAQSGIDLWWTYGLASDDVFFGGTQGAILHYDGATITRMTTPATGTVFGIWGAAANDVWAVGDGGTAPLVWHYDGTQWSVPSLPAGAPPRVFKVTGRASDDVWMSCEDGSALHWDGTSLVREPTGVTASLFSIAATPDAIIAVGGASGAGQIAERSSTAWTIATLQVPATWRGVATRDDQAVVVGELGAVARRDAGSWSVLRQPLTQRNFHAAWIDPDGGIWGVGGAFDQLPLTSDGFVLYYGPAESDFGGVSP